MMPAESAYLGMVGKNKQVELLFLLLLISALVHDNVATVRDVLPGNHKGMV
jgi:hypothetical protein